MKMTEKPIPRVPCPTCGKRVALRPGGYTVAHKRPIHADQPVRTCTGGRPQEGTS